MQLNKCQNMWSTLYLSDGFNSGNNPVETIWDEGLLMTGWCIKVSKWMNAYFSKKMIFIILHSFNEHKYNNN